MITRDLVKSEIDKVQDKYLEILYKIIKALIAPTDLIAITPNAIDMPTTTKAKNWHQFIDDTYGCLADDPITRGNQGVYEIREVIE